MDWDDYYSTDDIHQFIDELAANYDFVETFSIGNTYEDREQRVIKIGSGSNKPIVWVEAGMLLICIN